MLNWQSTLNSYNELMIENLITAGVDIGSSTSKVVLLHGDNILGQNIIPTGAESAKSARQVMDQALNSANLSLPEIGYIMATGYGRVIVPFAHEILTELTCHAVGKIIFCLVPYYSARGFLLPQEWQQHKTVIPAKAGIYKGTYSWQNLYLFRG